ncbi:adhesion G protein-coupled receptor B2 [Trichonephila clavipes]|uniref:Adhesion G protein-coupled receptor B2 n=1 Tax=Trichonephila clavipes TaxID=2585209 RepID=A0A8X6VX14_TRICX|nr:adhesion G protein-coupled receptor B2 [Trichonephila clavipes]
MYYSIDMNFFYSKDTLVALHFKYDFWHRTATAGSDVVQSGRPIFDDFFQHLWPYIRNNTVNVVFQMGKRLWLIRIDQWLYIAPQKNSLSGVKSQDFGGQFTGPKREIRRSPNVSFNKSIVARAV